MTWTPAAGHCCSGWITVTRAENLQIFTQKIRPQICYFNIIDLSFSVIHRSLADMGHMGMVQYIVLQYFQKGKTSTVYCSVPEKKHIFRISLNFAEIIKNPFRQFWPSGVLYMCTAVKNLVIIFTKIKVKISWCFWPSFLFKLIWYYDSWNTMFLSTISRIWRYFNFTDDF